MRSWSSTRSSLAAVGRNVRSLSDALLLLKISAVAASTPLLARLSLERLERVLEPRPRAVVPRPDRIERIVRYMDYVLRVGRGMVRSRCLTRGITLYYFLRRAGLEVELCYGVGTPADEFAGHCWLELQGEPYAERRDPRIHFVESYRIPRRSPGAVSARVEVAACRR
jgi:hypothetical protein